MDKKHKRLSKLLSVREDGCNEEEMQSRLHAYQRGEGKDGMIRPFYLQFKGVLKQVISTRGPWWVEVALPYFNKRYSLLYPVTAYNDYVFMQVDEPIDTVRCYYVVFKSGADRWLTRFFFSAASARMYFEYLKSCKEHPGNPEGWGHRTIESMRKQLEEARERNQ